MFTIYMPEGVGLEALGELEQAGAVRTLDEDVIALGSLFVDGGFDLLHVVELAVRALNIGKLVAHEPHLVEVALAQHLNDASVLFAAALAQFAHLAQNGHFGTHLHEFEVFECCSHGSGVGVVGINDELVVWSGGEL